MPTVVDRDAVVALLEQQHAQLVEVLRSSDVGAYAAMGDLSSGRMYATTRSSPVWWYGYGRLPM